MINYEESYMDFSPLFIDGKLGNSVYIEKSNFLAKLGKGVKSVEFITLRPKSKLYFIEAKTTAPNPATPNNEENTHTYCQDLLDKMQHSLDLFVSREVGINIDTDVDFPECFDKVLLADYEIVFLLIITDHEKEWCSDIQDMLHRKLIALRKIWKADVIVLTGKQALDNGFISQIIPKEERKQKIKH